MPLFAWSPGNRSLRVCYSRFCGAIREVYKTAMSAYWPLARAGPCGLALKLKLLPCPFTRCWPELAPVAPAGPEQGAKAALRCQPGIPRAVPLTCGCGRHAPFTFSSCVPLFSCGAKGPLRLPLSHAGGRCRCEIPFACCTLCNSTCALRVRPAGHGWPTSLLFALGAAFMLRDCRHPQCCAVHDGHRAVDWPEGHELQAECCTHYVPNCLLCST